MDKGSFLKTGEFLGVGDYLVSDNKSYFAVMQSDGNLAVYKGTDPSHPDRNAPNNGFVWGSVQAGRYPANQGQYFAVMQSDGNLAVYKGTDPSHPDRNAPNNGFVWGSVQDGRYPASQGQYFVVMQGDGNLAVYKGTDPSHPDRNAPDNGFVWGSIQSNRRIDARNTPPTGTSPLTAEQQQTLEAHNRERQNYPGVGPLQWSPELGQYAQEWAQTLADAGGSGNHRQDYRNNPFRPGEGLGENIRWGGPATGADAVQGWISEKQWYHYDRDDGMAGWGNQLPGCTAPPGKFCGHFTQVIWGATQFVGCGKATSASGTVSFVCNYYPSGNWKGQKPY